MIRVECMVVGPVSTNCYFLLNEELKEAVIIDPGEEAENIQSFLEKGGWKPVGILLTHGHYDHILAAERLREQYQIPVYACAEEEQVLHDPALNRTRWSAPAEYVMDADVYCREGDEIHLAGCRIRVLETPGHTPGGCCYYIASQNLLFSGDTLFFRSVGRTDFEKGSYEELCAGIKKKLFVLPADTLCYPGHGGMTKVGYEKEHNPYVR